MKIQYELEISKIHKGVHVVNDAGVSWRSPKLPHLKEEDDGFSNTVFYLLNPTNKNGAILSTSTSWYMEYSSKRIIYFDLSRRGLDDGRIYNNTYDEIRKKVDKKCKYVKNIDFGNNIFKAYSCKKAKFDGLIGFALRDDGFGMIKTFPSE